MNLKEKCPLVTIIVPVYNGEKTLIRCLDSLAYQTCRNFEVMVIDKESTDNSKEIESRYAKAFPDIFKVIDRPYSDSSAAAMRYGLSHANGEYITRCDPDDWYQLDAVETMEKAVFENATDFIIFAAKGIIYSSGVYSERNISCTQPASIPNLIMNREMQAYWNKIFRKELISEIEPILEDIQSEDWFYITSLASWAKSVSFVNHIIYNYAMGIGVTSNKISVINNSLIKSYDYILRNANMRKYKEEIYFAIITRIHLAYSGYWRYRHELACWVNEHRNDLANNKYLLNFPFHAKTVNRILDYSFNIPATAYVDGISRSWSQDEIDSLREKAFNYGAGDIVVLDKDMLNELPPYAIEAYNNGEIKYAVEFLALKKIYENGGYFVGKRVRFITSLTCLEQEPTFFSFDGNSSFTGEIYGAKPNSEVIGELLNTYMIKDFYSNYLCTLSDRIKNILCSLYDIPLNGALKRNQYVTVFDVSICVINYNEGFRVCFLDYSDLAFTKEYTVIKNENLVKKLPVSGKVDPEALQKQINTLKKQLANIKNADSYKFAMHLKSFGNSKLGAPFKKIFKWCIRKFRKHKYGI